jgi:hypothetical protein
MPSDVFLKIGGFAGESSDAKHNHRRLGPQGQEEGPNPTPNR